VYGERFHGGLAMSSSSSAAQVAKPRAQAATWEDLMAPRRGLRHFVVASLAALVGCSTVSTYQARGGWGGGYADEKLADGVFRVTYVVTPGTATQDATRFWTMRARELCGPDVTDLHHKTTMRGIGMQSPYAEGYVRCPGATAQVATIRDTAISDGPSKAQIYFVDKVQGKEVDNALRATARANANRGLNMAPQEVERQVLADSEVAVALRGEVTFAAPILYLVNMGKAYKVAQLLQFRLKPNGVYRVVGRLAETGSAVWLEDEETGDKMPATGPAIDPQASK